MGWIQGPVRTFLAPSTSNGKAHGMTDAGGIRRYSTCTVGTSLPPQSVSTRLPLPRAIVAILCVWCVSTYCMCVYERVCVCVRVGVCGPDPIPATLPRVSTCLLTRLLAPSLPPVCPSTSRAAISCPRCPAVHGAILYCPKYHPTSFL